MDISQLVFTFLFLAILFFKGFEIDAEDLETNMCGSTLKLLDCDIDEIKTFSRMVQNQFRVEYTPGEKCNITNTRFDWMFSTAGSATNLSNYKGKDVFTLGPYAIRTGEISIKIQVREDLAPDNRTTRSLAFDLCKINIKKELPLPIITGGPKRTIPSGQDIIVSGKESRDQNVKPTDVNKLKYAWKCNVTGVKTNFCNRNLGTENFITIPKRDAVEDAIFTVSLSVTTDDSDWQSTEQVIEIKTIVTTETPETTETTETTEVSEVSEVIDISPTMYIDCLKNCPPETPKTNSKRLTMFEAVCSKGCKKMAGRYRWSINIPGFNYGKNTKNGRNTDLFEIQENVLEPGKNYVVELHIRGAAKKWTKKIDVHKPPKLKSCSITPPNGEALTTQFKVSCEYDPGKYKFEIHGVTENSVVLIKSGDNLNQLSFPLSAGSKAKVKIFDQYHFTDEQTLDVEVTSLIKTTGSEEDIDDAINDKYFDEKSKFSIGNLMDSHDYQKVMQIANSLADDMEHLKGDGKDDVARKYHTKILDNLDQIPINTGEDAKKLSAITTKITELYQKKPDPDIATLGINICEKSSDKMLDDVENEEYPGSRAEEMKENALTITKCSRAAGAANVDAVTGVKAIPISTPYPLVNVPVNTENYPDYTDDQNSSKSVKKFDRSASSVMHMCFSMSKLLLTIITPRDDPLIIESSSFCISATLRVGERILTTNVSSQGITLIPPAQFADTRNPIHIAMCTSTQNMFWWLLEGNIMTGLLMIRFHEKGKVVSDFTTPFTIIFNVEANATSLIANHSSAMPKTPKMVGGLTSNKSNSDELDLYRITATSKRPFIVEFKNVAADLDLYVAIEHFYKPTMEEFNATKQKIDKNNNQLFIANDKPYYSWYYLIVSAKSLSGREPPPYNFSVYSMGCYRWSHNGWVYAYPMSHGSNSTVIKCECDHASAFVVRSSNNDVKLEETLLEELVLDVEVSYIIIISVGVAFILYCIFLTLFSITGVDEVTEELLFYLSDVPSFYRYGYVLIVKTGNKLKASTTSNVTIKVYGTRSESKAHVLNYPDPEMKLLQKNEENWFFMATESYLGDVEKIQLWCDFIGFSPSWFCGDVEIFDIQQNKYWLFQINKWFEILINEQMSYTAYPTELKETKSKKVIIFRFLKRIKNSFRGAHMWNIMSNEEQGITRRKRLHIIYSIFLSTYMIALLFYGLPKMENSDSLSDTSYFTIDRYIFYVAAACILITFVVHFPIVWYFRYPKKNILGKYQKVLKQYPLHTNFLCWLFLITNIIVSMTVLIIFGFWVPHCVGLMWLTSVAVSILVYIIIMENIKRLIFNFTITPARRIEKCFQYIKQRLHTVEKQRVLLFNMFGPLSLRPFFTHLYRPLHPRKLKEHKYWAELRSKLWEIVEDLIMISIYVLLLYLVILMDRNINTFISHQGAEDMVHGVFSRTNLLKNVVHRKEMEKFVNNTIIFSLQSLQWYGKYVWKNPGMTIDSFNKYLGVVRLRQHRVKGIPCESDIINQSVCYPTYFWYPENTDFSESWGNDNMSSKYLRLDHVWNYMFDATAGSNRYIGTFAFYPGGGYIVKLGRTMQNSILNFNYLMRTLWIDSRTRCFFVEFLMYNPSNNLFNSVRINFEFYATGYMHFDYRIYTAKLLFIKEEISIMFWVILLSFLIMLVALVVKLVMRLIQKKKLALKDIWHIIDMAIVLMSLLCLGLYIARSDGVRLFLLQLEKVKNNEFINYFHLMHTESTLTISAAVLVFISTLRLWKLMRFMQIVRITEKTLLLSARPLLGLFLYQFLFVVTCTLYGVVSYGDCDKDFRGIVTTILNLFIISLNLYPDFNFELISDRLGYIYYSMYMIVTLGIYTLYIAIITFCYAEAQFYYSNKQEYNIANLLTEQFHYYKELLTTKWRNFRLRGGAEKNVSFRKVYPKADVFRYANCVTLPINKMEAMSYVTVCVLKNLNKKGIPSMTDADTDLIKQTIVSLYREDTEDKEVFLMCAGESDRVKLINDTVMQKMERIVEELFVTDADRAEKEERKNFCKKIMESHDQKIKELADSLDVISNALSMVNIEE